MANIELEVVFHGVPDTFKMIVSATDFDNINSMLLRIRSELSRHGQQTGALTVIWVFHRNRFHRLNQKSFGSVAQHAPKVSCIRFAVAVEDCPSRTLWCPRHWRRSDGSDRSGSTWSLSTSQSYSSSSKNDATAGALTGLGPTSPSAFPAGSFMAAMQGVAGSPSRLPPSSKYSDNLLPRIGSCITAKLRSGKMCKYTVVDLDPPDRICLSAEETSTEADVIWISALDERYAPVLAAMKGRMAAQDKPSSSSVDDAGGGGRRGGPQVYDADRVATEAFRSAPQVPAHAPSRPQAQAPAQSRPTMPAPRNQDNSRMLPSSNARGDANLVYKQPMPSPSIPSAQPATSLNFIGLQPVHPQPGLRPDNLATLSPAARLLSRQSTSFDSKSSNSGSPTPSSVPAPVTANLNAYDPTISKNFGAAPPNVFNAW